MKLALQSGQISEGFFWPSAADYLAAMSKNYTFVDNLFLKFFAVLTNRDIIILTLHPEAASINQEFTWIFGMSILLFVFLKFKFRWGLQQ